METPAGARKVVSLLAAVLVLVVLLLPGISTAADDMGDFDVVKEPSCSNDSADMAFWMGMTGLLGKLVAETPKHKAKDGGFNYSASTEFGPDGEGTASCVSGKNDVACGSCLGSAVGRVSSKCSGKTSGSVELKTCQVSFKKD